MLRRRSCKQRRGRIAGLLDGPTNHPPTRNGVSARPRRRGCSVASSLEALMATVRCRVLRRRGATPCRRPRDPDMVRPGCGYWTSRFQRQRPSALVACCRGANMGAVRRCQPDGAVRSTGAAVPLYIRGWHGQFARPSHHLGSPSVFRTEAGTAAAVKMLRSV